MPTMRVGCTRSRVLDGGSTPPISTKLNRPSQRLGRFGCRSRGVRVALEAGFHLRGGRLLRLAAARRSLYFGRDDEGGDSIAPSFNATS